MFKSFVTLRTGNDRIHGLGYHAVAPRVIVDAPLIVKTLGIGRAKLNRRQRSACRGGYRNAFNPCRQ
jgi:hypothetical protein